MNCNDAKPLLDLMVDDELEAKDSALVLDHLKTCASCQDEWSDLEDLRSRFQSAKKEPTVPAGLMDKISERLKEEEKITRKPQYSFLIRALPVMAVAACILLIGLFVLPGHQSSSPQQIASANALIDDLARLDAVTPIAKSELSNSLGYDVKFVHLPRWQMNQAGVYRSQSQSPIARFDFTRPAGEGKEVAQMSCYQGLQGSIKTEGAVAENIEGKSVYFGKRGQYEYALMSKDGRDYLFVTALPKAQLEEIVRGA